MLITVQNLKKDYAGTTVLDGLDFQLDPGRKVGLIGRNGAGKTTLLRLLTNADDDYEGRIARAPGLKVGFAGQHFPAFDGTALEWLTADLAPLAADLARLEDLMATAEGDALDKVLADYGTLRERWDAAGGDAASDRARTLLGTLGLSHRENTATASLSGGEQNLLAIAKALVDRPDLLILDEPGNHLDVWGQAWLEDFLRDYPAAVLVVSHNRTLLDRTVERILDLDAGKVRSWAGNYSAHRLEKLKLACAQGLNFNADQKKLERLEALVKRFREIASATSDPAWGKRLHARQTQLNKFKDSATEAPEVDRARLAVAFTGRVSGSTLALRVSGYSRAWGERVLFDRAGFEMEVGERVALVGPNGCGKTTFLTDLVDQGGWENPVLRIGPSLRVGYVSQKQTVFDPGLTLLEEFERLKPTGRQAVHGLLGRFLFGWNDLDKKVGSLSGGELNRLQLARAVFLEADFLILDEPTNHLDIPSREGVEEGLADFKGTLLTVSHDRYFLDQTVNRIVEVRDRGFDSWDGTFSEFWAARSALEAAPAEAERRALEKKAADHLAAGRYAEGRAAAAELEKQRRKR
jgi:ATP-binding cassette subfamily F protein 3